MDYISQPPLQCGDYLTKLFNLRSANNVYALQGEGVAASPSLPATQNRGWCQGPRGGGGEQPSGDGTSADKSVTLRQALSFLTKTPLSFPKSPPSSTMAIL